MILKFISGITLILFGLTAIIFYANKQATKIPELDANAYLQKKKSGKGKSVVCLGDSLTHGRVSFDYVNELANDPSLKDYIFINEGINSQLAYNLTQKLEKIIEIQPDYVTILIGTNDLKGSLSEEEYIRYNKLWNLPNKPTLTWYLENLNQIINSLKAKTKAKIVIISIPPLGEKINSIPYQKSIEYSKEIKEVAQKQNISYKAFNEELTEELINLKKENTIPYQLNLFELYTAIFQYYVLFKSWDEISEAKNLYFLTDNVHLNSKAGKKISRMIKEFLLKTKSTKI